MHGRLKVRTTEEQKLLKEKENNKKLGLYKKGMTFILGSRRKDSYDEEAFKLSTQILQNNPHVYTLWNYRKEVLLIEIERRDKEPEFLIEEFLDTELRFVEQCIIISPKCYSAWHHRYWVLNNHPKPNWKEEFKLCSKFLARDDRNLHGWDYRRLIINKIGRILNEELKFSTDRIRTNFSNYSSWHYRSTLRTLDEDNLEEELNLVINAVYTDPNDSSAWFYFRWILSHKELLKEKCEKVLDDLMVLEQMEPDCKWVLIAKNWASQILSDDDNIINRKSYAECDLPKLIDMDPLRKARYVDELKKVTDSIGDNN